MSSKNQFRTAWSGEMWLAQPKHEIFPLLCPVREFEWVPGWQCEIIFLARAWPSRTAFSLPRTHNLAPMSGSFPRINPMTTSSSFAPTGFGSSVMIFV